MKALPSLISWPWFGQVLCGAASIVAAAWLLGPTTRTFLQSGAVVDADRLVAAY